ncbi:hypothetical protein AB1Y20_013219 [Prymnesium parvum]|uniref:Uncharacterized protein n=1 Tax=Prymnesium parvum TaxID=97485 RepID=A0AB34IM47_PRYPA
MIATPGTVGCGRERHNLHRRVDEPHSPPHASPSASYQWNGGYVTPQLDAGMEARLPYPTRLPGPGGRGDARAGARSKASASSVPPSVLETDEVFQELFGDLYVGDGKELAAERRPYAPAGRLCTERLCCTSPRSMLDGANTHRTWGAETTGGWRAQRGEQNDGGWRVGGVTARSAHDGASTHRTSGAGTARSGRAPRAELHQPHVASWPPVRKGIEDSDGRLPAWLSSCILWGFWLLQALCCILLADPEHIYIPFNEQLGFLEVVVLLALGLTCYGLCLFYCPATLHGAPKLDAWQPLKEIKIELEHTSPTQQRGTVDAPAEKKAPSSPSRKLASAVVPPFLSPSKRVRAAQPAPGSERSISPTAGRCERQGFRTKSKAIAEGKSQETPLVRCKVIRQPKPFDVSQSGAPLSRSAAALSQLAAPMSQSAGSMSTVSKNRRAGSAYGSKKGRTGKGSVKASEQENASLDDQKTAFTSSDPNPALAQYQCVLRKPEIPKQVPIAKKCSCPKSSSSAPPPTDSGMQTAEDLLSDEQRWLASKVIIELKRLLPSSHTDSKALLDAYAEFDWRLESLATKQVSVVPSMTVSSSFDACICPRQSA